MLRACNCLRFGMGYSLSLSIWIYIYSKSRVCSEFVVSFHPRGRKSVTPECTIVKRFSTPSMQIPVNGWTENLFIRTESGDCCFIPLKHVIPRNVSIISESITVIHHWDRHFLSYLTITGGFAFLGVKISIVIPEW